MTTYYVAKNGVNTNPGTSQLPRLTIQSGATLLQPGDTLIIRAGTYAERPQNIFPSGANSTTPTTIQAEVPGTVIIRPDTNTPNTQVILVQSRQFINLIGLTVDSFNHTSAGIFLNTCSGVLIDNCDVYNMPQFTGTAAGVWVSSTSTTVTVRNTRVHDIGTIGSQVENPNDHGILISGSSCVVENCTVNNNNGYGIALQHLAGLANNNIIRNNRINNNLFRGILVGGNGNDNLVYNNLIYDNSGDGVVVGGFGQSLRNKVYYNTITRNGGDGIQISGNDGIVRNNIVYQNGSSISNTSINLASSNNLTELNPLFTSSTDFHVLSGSPAIAGGIPVAEVTTDFDGVVRGALPTIGAYEGSSLAPPPGPSNQVTCDDTLSWSKVIVGTLEPVNLSVKTVTFTARVGRYVALRSLTSFRASSGQNDAPWAVLAELGVLSNGTPISKAGWLVHCVTSQELINENAPASNAIDGNTTTYWYTQWHDPVAQHPHCIVIDLGQSYTITGFTYTPTAYSNFDGYIVQYEFFVGTTSEMVAKSPLINLFQVLRAS